MFVNIENRDTAPETQISVFSPFFLNIPVSALPEIEASADHFSKEDSSTKGQEAGITVGC